MHAFIPSVSPLSKQSNNFSAATASSELPYPGTLEQEDIPRITNVNQRYLGSWGTKSNYLHEVESSWYTNGQQFENTNVFDANFETKTISLWDGLVAQNTFSGLPWNPEVFSLTNEREAKRRNVKEPLGAHVRSFERAWDKDVKRERTSGRTR